jgi:hypothetical protein
LHAKESGKAHGVASSANLTLYPGRP